MIELLLIFPLAGAALLFYLKSQRINNYVMLIYSLLAFSVSVLLVKQDSSFTKFFATDKLNILFLCIQNLLFFGVSFYNIVYMKHQKIVDKLHTNYTIFVMLFVFSMNGVLLSTNLGLMWVFVEATTLTSAYLIYFNRTKAALEAAWKYIFICSIGISLAFVGIIFLSIGAGELSSLHFRDLYEHAAKINPFWMKLAFTFILIGFGTKAGLAPVHTWLPDAHSESPSPISALLSGTLLNSALLAILKVYKIASLCGIENFAKNLLLVMGFLSLFFSAVYLIRVKNYKRMLAWSSIENMGIIVIGIALGGVGAFAAMLHVFAHSLTKAAFFMTSGNILHKYGKKEIDGISGLIHNNPLTGWLWILCLLAITGCPPFPIFISELLMGKTMLEAHNFTQFGLFFILLTIIFFGMARSVIIMSLGKSSHEVSKEKDPLMFYIPQIAFIILLLIIGIFQPGIIMKIISEAAKII